MFDYVIVGAGSAGCVLANRLSDDPDARVLLLEAGGEDRSPNIHIPAAFHKLFRGPCDWDYRTEPQEHLNGRRLYHPRGKVLGGCSSMNAMIYVHGHPADYDGWAALGCAGWDHETLRPYFHRSDDLLTVGEQRCPNPLSEAFIDAAAELGHDGFGLFPVTQREGRRWSTARAFLEPARSRPNLDVWTDAHARRVLLEDGRATGVEVRVGGTVREVRARREVIVAAGAFGSPHLLMLSGIGPAAHLREHGLPVEVDLPGVGENLQDHLVCGVARRSSFRDTLDTAEGLRRIGRNLFDYFLRRTGPFTSNVAEAGGFVRSSPELDAPDIQFHFGPGFFIEHGFGNPKNEPGISLGGLVLTPDSRGTVRLAGPDPHQKPLVDPRYLSDPDDRDLRRSVWAFRLTQRILAAPALAPFDAGPYLPERTLQTADEIADFIRARAETLYHPVGTCRMGTDPMAVVDPELRVRDVDGLRVADASVMPTITRGNTNAPVIMIAEKAAALVRAPAALPA